jgi:hypothetical protein
VTTAQGTRWTQRDGQVNSVRYCEWPGCPSRYPVARGPALEGWAEFGVTNQKITLCPFHSTGRHRPRLVLPSRDVLVTAECTCSSWVGRPTAHVSDAIREWQEHIETALELEKSA